MTRLRVSIGQCSQAGAKQANQDFYGAVIPEGPVLTLKGIALAIADGISSSEVSRVASESAVKGFLADYYCTSDAWSVKTSAERVLSATNSWLHAQTRRSQWAYDRDKGYVCTFSGLVLKSATAHLFHVGDSRIYRLSENALEQLTEDHRLVVSSSESFLSRALGMDRNIEIDYRAVPLQPGDVFVMATDGVHDHVTAQGIAGRIAAHAGDLDAAAHAIVAAALECGSHDNLTVQIVRVEDVPAGEAHDLIGHARELPPPPLPSPRQMLDGYRIERQIHGSSRSHIYLATDLESGSPVVLKLPSVDLRGDPDYLKRLLMEEWIARRIDNPHVLKAAPSRLRSSLYTAMEYVEGQTLAQWMRDNPRPDLEVLRGIVEQIAKGLNAFHRKDMLHQDLRPENVMIDRCGTVKIIDFGSARVEGAMEALRAPDRAEILGTIQYSAPEYHLGQGGTIRSDLYSLAVITYQMLTGRLPYGARTAAARSRVEQRRLVYTSVLDETGTVPAWIDDVLETALSVDPGKRFADTSEFVYALRHPRSARRVQPLLERNPNVFWKAAAAVFGILSVIELIYILGHI
ncbi:MAG: bifunctional protein-serine/threonine kinase/phosphatase [Pseudomonadota bacterium]